MNPKLISLKRWMNKNHPGLWEKFNNNFCAQRGQQIKFFPKNSDLKKEYLICAAFVWVWTPEGNKFWERYSKQWEKHLMNRVR